MFNMLVDEKIELRSDLKPFERKIICFLYGPLLSQKGLHLLLNLRYLASGKNELQFSLKILLRVIKISIKQLTTIFCELEKYHLIKWSNQSLKNTSSFKVELLPVKTIEQFFAEQKLIDQLEKKLSEAEIDQILFSLIDDRKHEKLQILKQLQLPEQIRQQAKLRDLYALDQIYHENGLSLAIFQKIVDFIWVKTATINGNYLKKLITTLKMRQILNSETKITDYFLSLFRKQTLHQTVQQINQLPSWMVNESEKKTLKRNFQFEKLLSY